MDSRSVTNRPPSGSAIHSGERRKNPRFDLHFLAFMRALRDSWAMGETADVSAAGTFFVTDRPLPLSTPIEYVLTFPPDLTKAPKPLRVWFLGNVLRCKRVPDGSGSFGIAVRNVNHRYLNPELSASFDAIELKLSATSSAATTIQPRKGPSWLSFRAASLSEVYFMEDTTHVNPFEDVHKKAQAAKDRARKVREKDTELRERNEHRKAAAEDAKNKTR